MRKLIALFSVATVATLGLALAGTGASGAPAQQTFGPGSHAFIVPAGVTSITTEAQGGAGGRESGDPQYDLSVGGLGGKATATIAVTPGETLTLIVGAEGAVGGSGGGATFVRRGATSLVVAGGGGGGGDTLDNIHMGGAGGAGGGSAPGGDGDPVIGGCTVGIGGSAGAVGGAGGAGGIDTAPPGANGGAGGNGGAVFPGLGGTRGTGAGHEGGEGGQGHVGGGGGGSGAFGDDAFGCAGGSGGGGSSFADPITTGATFASGVRAGAGQLIVTYEVPDVPQISVVAGNGNTVEVNGSGYPPNTDVVVSIASDPVVLGTLTANASGAFSGSFDVPCTIGDGAHTVTATATGGTSASSAVTLVGCAVVAQATTTG